MPVPDQQPGRLNPALWNGDKLKPEVRARLLRIAYDFLSGIKAPGLSPIDLLLTGSNANLNWSAASDVDLHIVIDPKKIACPAEVTKDYFHDAASIWNEHHLVRFFGHEIEIYMQDAAEPLYASGVYSLMKGKWLQRPVDAVDPSSDVVTRKAEALLARIDKLIARPATQASLDAMQALRERIRTMRRAALAKGGEHSIENLAFKVVRRKGGLERLSHAARAVYDTIMTLEGATAPGALSMVEELEAIAWG